MLLMHPDCQRCGEYRVNSAPRCSGHAGGMADPILLPANAGGAFICSMECTYCAECADELDERCPDCGGELLDRPTRTGKALKEHPAATGRRHRA